MRFLLGIIALIVAAPILSADNKDKIPVERSTNDRQIIDTLAEIHDQGAALFSSGDVGGSYRMFQGGLMAMRLLLPKNLQETVDVGLADARRIPSMSDRAMRLHELIEDVRKKLRPTAGPKATGTLLNPPRTVGTSASIEPLPMAPYPEKEKEKEPMPKKSDPVIVAPIVPVTNPGRGAPAPVTTAPPSDEPPSITPMQPLPFVPKIPNPDGK